MTGGGTLPEGLEYLLPIGYTGEQRDPESGLTYLRARTMDAGSGRFMSLDTVAGFLHQSQSLNQYAYVMNNPMSRVDPRGMQGVMVDEWFTPYRFPKGHEPIRPLPLPIPPLRPPDPSGPATEPFATTRIHLTQPHLGDQSRRGVGYS